MKPIAAVQQLVSSASFVALAGVAGAAGTADLEWLTRYDGPGVSNDVGLAMELDASGNVYVAGYSYGADDDDAVRLIKLSPGGALLWERSWDGGFGWDDARDLAVAADGTVTIAGFTAVADPFDQDALVARWSPDGQLLWVRTWSGPGRDDAKSVALDALGNAYVGVESDAGDGSQDYVTVKIDAAGDVAWATRRDGESSWSDSVGAIAVTPDGISTLTGTARGAESFDLVTVQLAADGQPRWSDSYNPRGNYYEAGIDVALDADGAAYAVGSELTETGNMSMVLIRYETGGARGWVRTFDDDLATYDNAYAVAVGANGTIAITGCTEVSSDDPDVATVLFGADGTRLWSSFAGPRLRGDDCGRDVAIAGDGSVAVAGSSIGFGSGIPIDYLALRHSGAGQLQWAERYDGPTGEIDEANAVAFAADGDVIVSGVSRDAGNLDIGVLRYAGTGTGGPGGCAASVAGASGSVSAIASLVALMAVPAARRRMARRYPLERRLPAS